MNIINWANFDFKEFTNFCNALLAFEVSKKVKPFSAPGRDGGIDASYVGEYDGMLGTWRFQYKFHKVARKQGFHLLKNELMAEMRQLKNENYFVLMTNVELLPQEQSELESSFESNRSENSSTTRLLIWDGAKLQTLHIRHPLLSIWLDDGFDTAQLQDYKIYYKKGLEAADFVPYTLNNIFVGREKKLSELEDFLDSNSVLALIEGEAGIGKTRLIIEFFKYIDQKEIWRPLVLANKTIDFDRIKKSLSVEGQYIILVDDAHSYDAVDIADLKRIADISEGQIKLILTARSLEASKSLQQIKEFDQDEIVRINITTLNRAETLDAIEPYTKGGVYKHHLSELVNISYGRPVLIVAVLRAIQMNTRISTIRQNNFLKSYVNNYFDEFHIEFTNTTNVSNLASKRLLRNIAFIEPFSFGDHSIVQKLSEIHKISVSEVNHAFQILKEYSLVSGKYEQSIKPDYYSDIILQDINFREASEYISEFSAQLDNIIINLSSVDEINNEKGGLLNETLEKYVDWIVVIDNDLGIDATEKIAIIGRILNTISSIVYVRPHIAHRAVELYMVNILKTNHPIRIEYDATSNSFPIIGESHISKIITILSRLLYFPTSYAFVFESFLKLYATTRDRTIFTLYNFSKQDVIENFKLERQKYVISRLKSSQSILQDNFLIIKEILKGMLMLDFTITEQSPSSRDAISITTYMLPSRENIQNFRIKIIDILCLSYNLQTKSEFKFEILKLLLDIVRGILATRRNSTIYQGDQEIVKVLDFIEAHGESFGLMEKTEVIDKLYWFGKWGIENKFQQQIAIIRGILSPKNLTEKLSQIFSSSETSLVDRQNIHSYIAEQCDLIADNVSEDELSLAMQSFLEPQPYPPHFFWEFLRRLEKNHFKHALHFHDYLFKHKSPLYYRYASDILSSLRFDRNDEKAYWIRIKELENLDSYQADNVILQNYGNRVPGSTTLTEQDAEIIVKIFEKGKSENDSALAGALQSLIACGYKDLINLLQRYLDRAHQRDAEMFFIWLSDNSTASNELIKTLVLKSTIRFYLSYEIERILAKVLENYGVQTVFNYLIRRYEYKKEIVLSTKTLIGYDFVPYSEHSNLFEQDASQNVEMFEMALSWYTNVDAAGGHLFYAKDLLEYLKPNDFISKEIFLVYEKIINTNKENLDALYRITESLSLFHLKDSQLLALIIIIYDHSIAIKELNLELLSEINYSMQYAITNVGVKTGTPGQPFQVDIDLRDLLIRETNLMPDYVKAKTFLLDVLKNINKEIDRDRDYDNETW